MRVFQEEQAFRQWWLFLILGSGLLVTSIPFLKYNKGLEIQIWEFFGFFLISLIIMLFWQLRLRTRIDSTGVSAEFVPLRFFRKHFKWNEIDDCFVRQYLPIQEFGGWGVRGIGKARAYNVSGNMGIQIITKDKRKFLIGTNKPEEAKRILERYRKNIRYYEKHNFKHRPFSDSPNGNRAGKLHRGRSKDRPVH
ncbi:hypothetical protein MKO06_14620 [Gramella sp. GC03-9]|uniref:Uncharacterized protein n=1 Tax=Christiangramia oceanisediminis TaxID=2920386 RepID=A0A9X2KZL9_9FLAO|nr:hypothetical protein [Gramella oceanisediminis]MCP9201149.1 hypothetical protein [Gramella oceanisediminis]